MTDSPRRILIITAIVLAVFVALAIAVCVQPAGAQTVAPQLSLDYACLQGGHTEFSFSVSDFVDRRNLTDYGMVTFSGQAGATVDTAWPYVWTAHIVDSAVPMYLTQVDLPGAAVASVTGAALVITTASGPVILYLSNPQSTVAVLPACPAPPVSYVYGNCRNKMFRVYNGPNGYVYWGKPTALPATLPPGDWTAYPLPYVGKAQLVSLEGCRVAVRDSADLLWLDFDGSAWSLPAVGYRTYLPLAWR